MKKQKLILPVLAPAMILAGGLLANNTYADVITEGVYLTDNNAASIVCAYYTNASGIEACTDEAGVWDNTKKELTISSEADVEHLLNGNRIRIMSMGDSVKITSAVDLSETAIDTDSALTLDFGEKTLFVPSGSTNLITDSLTIDGGTVIFYDTPLSFKNITINDGALNAFKYLTVNNLEVNGGALNMQKAQIRIANNGMMDVKGGEIKSIVSDYGIELGSGATLTQTGGTINIDGGGELNTIGISGYDVTVDIKGGEMNLKNLQNGTWLYGDSVIKFEGGKTVIDKSGLHALYIQDLTDPENGIVFAEGMGIKEKDVVVHWDTAEDDEYNRSTTGISDNGTVTIEEGGTVTKKKGWTRGDSTPGDDDEEAPGSDGEEEEESDVKVPDTGASINSEEGGALSIFAASTFALLSVIALATAHKKHAAGHFKFDK